MRLIGIALAALSVSACSTIIDGTSQTIAINTNPPGADCGLYRKGIRIAEVQNTPGAALVEKTKDNMTLLCMKDGYQQSTYINRSGYTATSAGNLLLGGIIGLAVDSATGADNKYDSPVNITLVPADVRPPPVAALGTPAPQLPPTLPVGAPTT